MPASNTDWLRLSTCGMYLDTTTYLGKWDVVVASWQRLSQKEVLVLLVVIYLWAREYE
jgi:hypothetical protein